MSVISWAGLVVVFTIIIYTIEIWSMPYLITSRTLARIRKRNAFHRNVLYHGGLRWAYGSKHIKGPRDESKVNMDNPDTITSFCEYDVSKKRIRFKTGKIPQSGYWSISAYAWNTDNFFTLNNKHLQVSPESPLEIVFGKEKALSEAFSNARVVASPSSRGVILVRFCVDRYNTAEIESIKEIQKLAHIEEI